MAEPASISKGIAARYATAVFDLAQEQGEFDALAGDIDTLESALGDSPEFRRLVTSPLYSRDETRRGIGAVAERMGLSATMANTLGLMADKRRLFVLPHFLSGLRARIAEARGEVTARVTSARRLSDAQRQSLADTLGKKVGKTVQVSTAVDEGLIGGMVVRMGSRMIDTSIRAKLDALQNRMKEVG